MLRDVTSTLKVIGMVHAKKGDLDTAMMFFQEAMSLLRAPDIANTSSGRETMAAVLTRIASIHLKKADLDQAVASGLDQDPLGTVNLLLWFCTKKKVDQPKPLNDLKYMDRAPNTNDHREPTIASEAYPFTAEIPAAEDP